MSGRLGDLAVVVTGGAGGIGRAIVDVALREGARVAVLDVDADAGRALARARPQVVVEAVDLTDEEALEHALARVAEQVGTVDVLVNNAGRNSYGDAVAMTTPEWDDVFAVDLRAAWWCARQVLPGMLARGSGSIVNVASVHAHMTSEGTFPYGAAKAGLVGMTRSLALDVGPRGVRVNSVSPGYTRTALVTQSFAALGQSGQVAQIEAKHALRRMGEPHEVAEVVCFLASPAASFVTGADWVVDGGISARFA